MITVSYQFIEIIAFVSIMINIVTGMMLSHSKHYVISLHDLMDELVDNLSDEDKS
jgi:signal transduction histidine kinase